MLTLQEAQSWAAEFGLTLTVFDDCWLLGDRYGNGESCPVNCSEAEFRACVAETKDGEEEGAYWRSPAGRKAEFEEAFMRGEF